MARRDVPDIIISDVMMPEMDGLTFAKELKKYSETDHIPLVLLTVSSEESTEIESYRYQVDAYLTKPVSQALIRHRVKSLLDIRQKFQEAQHKMLTFSGKGRKVLESQHPFIQKLLPIIKERINLAGKVASYSFGVEDLAAEAYMERTSFYRKVVDILNITPSELLKVIKMERAASLLIETEDTIDSIAFQVGYRSDSAFCKAFNEYWKRSPTEFRSDYWL